MANKCAFTICTKSYIGYAQLLRNSVLRNSTDIDFFIMVADEFIDVKIDEEYIFEARKELKDISDDKWIEYAFKYNLTEFCTRIKPNSFKYFFNKNYDEVCYFDPDLYFFSSLDKVYNYFQHKIVLVTPHIVNMCVEERLDSNEFDARISGIFNFGFLGLKKCDKTINFLNWWDNRLDDKCYFDSVNFLCTDQKWGDLIPCYFNSDELYVSRSMGWNLAPWNFSERKIIYEDNKWYVENRYSNEGKEEVIFAHFSGYNYKKLFEGIIQQKNDHHGIAYEDITNFEKFYATEIMSIKEKFFKYINLPYTYNYYNNGVIIERMHRRLYHSYKMIGLKNFPANPFDINGEFYLKINRLKMFSGNSNDDFDKTINDKKSLSLLMKYNKIMRIVYRFFGYKRYLSILKLFQASSWYENQIHLLDNDVNVLFFRKRIL